MNIRSTLVSMASRPDTAKSYSWANSYQTLSHNVECESDATSVLISLHLCKRLDKLNTPVSSSARAAFEPIKTATG